MTATTRLARRLMVLNQFGIYARPSVWIIKAAMKHRKDTKVVLKCGESTAEGHSMLGILTLEAIQGRELIVEAEGPHAREVIEEITACVNEGFRTGEPCLDAPSWQGEWLDLPEKAD
ncbi:MAG: HPr family phosphocarrier protein [Phycisphaerae bacterium]|nr:HPr family phosphocarrier protein [Phycisphaerae bacterium]